ncbi:hypothetical protein EZV73_02990 [Acidaminobacter sp. JC074]|uniref:hypothetical protein n=1 Tax=Acidaminobacter sp. JC074 TaxID=2530199 RepID=UPI001F0D1FE3|nr:hypothetical protein [Acidaminobacter sp. JC074]MCH4886514.1 hypothetical protein [Acidaminobacter sp. JC074]
MKRLIYNLLIVSIILLLLSCGSNADIDESLSVKENLTSSQTTGSGDSANESESNSSSSALKERAKKEGVSVKEMESMIKELAEKTAETYQTTYEAYLSDLEKEGKTAFEEFQTAADFMGLTIKEYHEMEMSKPALSEEDQATVAAMNSAIADVDLGGDIEEYIEELQLLDIKQVEESMQMEGMFIVEYLSDTSLQVMMDHYDELLKFTDGYSFMDSGVSVTIFGTFRGGFVNVIMSEEVNNDMIRVVYTFTGDVDNLEETSEKTYEPVDGKSFLEWALFQMEDMIDSGENTSEGIEYVVFMTMSGEESVIDYYKSMLEDSENYSEANVSDELVLTGLVNGEKVTVSIASDAGVSYVQVNRYFDRVPEAKKTDVNSEDLMKWAIYSLKQVILEDHWNDGGLTLIYTSYASVEDLASHYRKEFKKYDDFKEYGSLDNNDLNFEASIDGVTITASAYKDLDTGDTKSMFTNSSTR